jgi:hypothetical protein
VGMLQYFGWSQEIKTCVKMLLSCVHDGYVWLDRPVSIDTDLIMCITSLLSHGHDPHIVVF